MTEQAFDKSVAQNFSCSKAPVSKLLCTIVQGAKSKLSSWPIYINLIDWQKTIWVEPPLTKNIREQDLMLYIANSDLTSLSLPKFPCHSQAVKRAVQLVSKVSRVVCGYERREGIIKNKLLSRSEMPKNLH